MRIIVQKKNCLSDFRWENFIKLRTGRYILPGGVHNKIYLIPLRLCNILMIPSLINRQFVWPPFKFSLHPPPIPPENYVILKSLKWLGGRILSSAKEDEEKDLHARELKIMLIFQSCCVPRESWDVLRNRSHVENAEPPRSGGEAAAHCRAMFCCSGWCF